MIRARRSYNVPAVTPPGGRQRPEDGTMGMQRTRGARGAALAGIESEAARQGPIRLDTLSVITGIGRIG